LSASATQPASPSSRQPSSASLSSPLSSPCEDGFLSVASSVLALQTTLHCSPVFMTSDELSTFAKELNWERL
jgi:hypothetical protein